MQISIVQIGNSKGIRLAKNILEQYQFGDKAELELKEGYLILKPVKKIREGWDEAFKKMAAAGDDALIMPDVFEDETWEE